MKNTLTHRGFVIEEGKEYFWSGSQEGLYSDTSWDRLRCKITKIEDGKVFIKQSIFGDVKSPKGSPDEIVELTSEELNKFNVNFFEKNFFTWY